MLLVLGGMKHVGKSSLGRRLASRYDVPFFDLDDRIVDVYNSKHDGQSTTVREIYRHHGRRVFRRLERIAARTLHDSVTVSAGTSNRGTAFSAVVALGGGTVENRAAFGVLCRAGLFVYLHEDAERLFARIIAGGVPPFLSPGDPREKFEMLFRKRTRLYAKKADIRIDLDGRSLDDAEKLTHATIQEYIDGRQ